MISRLFLQPPRPPLCAAPDIPIRCYSLCPRMFQSRVSTPRMFQSRGPCCFAAVSCPGWASRGLLVLPSWLPQSLAGVLAVPPGCSFICSPFTFVHCRVSLSRRFFRPLPFSPLLPWPFSPLPPSWSCSLLLILFPWAACSCRLPLIIQPQMFRSASSPDGPVHGLCLSTGPRIFQSSGPRILPAHSSPVLPVRAPCACHPVSPAPCMLQSTGPWCFVACSWPGCSSPWHRAHSPRAGRSFSFLLRRVSLSGPLRSSVSFSSQPTFLLLPPPPSWSRSLLFFLLALTDPKKLLLVCSHLCLFLVYVFENLADFQQLGMNSTQR